MWKQCLRRQCVLNNIFWPSYKNLSTVDDLRFAATTPKRFSKLYENAVKTRTLGRWEVGEALNLGTSLRPSSHLVSAYNPPLTVDAQRTPP